MFKLVSRLSFRHYKRFMVGLMATGLAAVALEIAAYGVVFGGIAVLSGGDLPKFLENLLISTSGNVQIIYGVTAFFVLMLMAAGLHYAAGWMAARCRKVTFGDNISRTLQGLIWAPDHPFVRGRGSKEISRALRRDCRYSSLALTEFIGLPRPVIVATLCIGAGFTFYPVIAAIALIILIASIPIHLRTGRYGIDVMERLIAEGAKKGRADRDAVEALLASPWGDKADIQKGHVARADVQGFLNAYENRVTLAPVSQLTSRIISTIVFAAVGAYMFWMFIEGNLKFTDIAVIFIAFRIFNAASAEIVQQLVIIVSYSPIMKRLFEFFAQSGEFDTASGLDVNGLNFVDVDGPLPRVLAIIDTGGPTRRLAEQLSNLYDLSADPLLGVPVPFPTGFSVDSEHLNRALAGSWADLSDPICEELRYAASSLADSAGLKATDRAMALLPLILSPEDDQPRLSLLEFRSFLELLPADRLLVQERATKNGPLAIIYRAYPKRYPHMFAGHLFTNNAGELISIDSDEAFHIMRSKSLARPAEQSSRLSVEMDDGF